MSTRTSGRKAIPDFRTPGGEVFLPIHNSQLVYIDGHYVNELTIIDNGPVVGACSERSLETYEDLGSSGCLFLG